MVLNCLVRYRVVQIPIGPCQYDTESLSTIQGRTNSHLSVSVRYWKFEYDTGSYKFPFVRFSMIVKVWVRYRVVRILICPFQYPDHNAFTVANMDTKINVPRKSLFIFSVNLCQRNFHKYIVLPSIIYNLKPNLVTYSPYTCKSPCKMCVIQLKCEWLFAYETCTKEHRSEIDNNK